MAVEFLVAPDDEPPPPRRRLGRRGMLVGGTTAAATAVAVIVLVSLGQHPPGPARPAPRPQVVVDTPTPGMIGLFRRSLPGSVVVAEHSVSSRSRRPALARRTIEVVTGNVVIEIVVRPASERAAHRRGSVDTRQGGYRIAYRFHGGYPPTRVQLERLSRDPRLTSLRD